MRPGHAIVCYIHGTPELPRTSPVRHDVGTYRRTNAPLGLAVAGWVCTILEAVGCMPGPHSEWRHVRDCAVRFIIPNEIS